MFYFKQLWSELLNLIFPPRYTCPLCGTTSKNGKICLRCRQEIINFQQQTHCNQCGRWKKFKKINYSSDKPEHDLNKTFYCTDCLSQEKVFKIARAAGIYEGNLKKAILEFKFKQQRYLAHFLGQLLVEVFWAHPAYQKVQVVVPVPLTPQRLCKRGFNQAELLAREVAKTLNLPLCLALIKVRETAPQTSLKREQRKDNLKRAFEVQKPSLIINKTVLLIDDVFTTGVTVEECSRNLLTAGANEVYVLTAATGSIYW